MAWWNRHRESPAFVPEPRDEGQKSVSFDLTTGPPPWQYQYGYGFLGDSYGGIYRKQPAVRTVVDFLSTNIGQLNLKTFARVGDADRIELDGHPLAVLLRRPNPETTKFRLFRDLVADQSIQDVAYWGKIRLRGQVRGLVRIPKSRIAVELVDLAVTYRNTVNHEVIPRENLVIFPGYHPDGNPWGISPMETLRQVLAEDWDATQHRRYFWKNAARRDGVIERSETAPEWSDTARSRFRSDWEATHSGALNAGRTPVLEDGMHWVPDAFSPKESEYLEGRRLTSEEVARAYGIAPKLLGMGEDTNANIESFHRQLYQDVLGPRLVAIEQEIELQLLPDLDNTPASTGRVYVEFNLGEKLKASFEEEMKVLVTSTGVPIISVNEARARQNLPGLDGEEWEVPIKPMNVMYGGQPAPTVPTATPASPPSEMPGKPTLRAAADGPAYMKADIPPAVERRRTAAADDQTEALVRYFRRQEKAYLGWSSRNAKGTKTAWDARRWDAVLHEILFSAAVPLAAQTGQRAARQIRGVYNEDQTTEFLAATTLSSARNINAKTMADLTAADDAEAALNVFAVAKGSRAEQLGLSQATGIINFARKEAAVQSQANDGRERMKTWVVTSRNSRHPELDGETVPVSENFSNGLAWPGDSAGDANETAGCHCLLNIDAEPGKAVVPAPLELPVATKAEPRDERPNFTINLPPPPELKMPNFRVDVRMPSSEPAPVYVESPTVNFHAPEQPAPDVKVYVESATVKVEPTPVNIQPADISVNIEPGDVHVAAPTVHVAAPEVNVKSADVNVNVEPPAVTIQPADVHVAAPEVTVQPTDVHIAPTYVNIEPPDIQIPPSNIQVDVAAPEVKLNVRPSEVHLKAPDVNIASPRPRKVRRTIERDAKGLPIGIIEEDIEDEPDE